MVLSVVSKVLLAIFGVRRASDFVLRPLLFLIAVAGLNIFLKTSFTSIQRSDLFLDTVLSVLTAAPFVVICYILLLYQAQEQRTLSVEAQTDELTGLPNRRAFFKRSDRALKSGASGFFLIIDADHFKRINDTLGHPSGDVCLQAVADRVRSLLREKDLIGRIGGEEFGVVLFDRTLEELHRLAGRLCYPISVSLLDQQKVQRLTLSAGATEIWPQDTIEALTTRADEALLAAKNNGRERMVLWRPAKKVA